MSRLIYFIYYLGAGGKYNAEEDRQMDRIRDELRATAVSTEIYEPAH